MIKYNEKLYIIGVDMGYGNMKTASCHFPTGIEKYDSKPGFAGDFLEFDGNYPFAQIMLSVPQPMSAIIEVPIISENLLMSAGYPCGNT